MSLRRTALLTMLTVFGVLLSAGGAAAAPIWNLDIHHNETNFPPNGTAEYWFDVNNVGDTSTSGPITLTINLPNGLKRDSLRVLRPELNWVCPGSPGDSTIVCTVTNGTSVPCAAGCSTELSLPRHTIERSLILTVDIGNVPPGTVRFATAKLSGGGAVNEATARERTRIDSIPASEGIVDESFVMDFYKRDALTPERQASVHPELLTSAFDFNTIASPKFPFKESAAASIRNLNVDLPPGFVGAPTAVGECDAVQLTLARCPGSSQVGRIDIATEVIVCTSCGGSQSINTGVFNMAHPRGSAADLAFVFAGNPVHIRISLDPANHYAISSRVPDINETLPAFHQKLTLWGVPADKSHDSERCPAFSTGGVISGDTGEECSTGTQPKPFLTAPAQCEDDNAMRLHHYDFWASSGVFGPDVDYPLPGKFINCEKPRFEPDVEIEPTGKQANTPTGLDVHVKIAQNENPNALATPPVKRFTVRLPDGMSFSPSFADGLQTCTLAQMKLGTNEAVQCPDASRVGEVELSTPLLPDRAEGSMYLGAQGDNPFGSTFALLLVLQDTEERGVLIKIPGRIDVDPVTGQITTVFNETPQFPFDDLTLKFRSGPRAPLVSPPSCGSHTIGIEVASYAQPLKPVDASNTYEVTEGPNGTPCPPESAKRPFNPSFSGGTLNPVAGTFSEFLFRMTREDDEQELSQVSTTLPEGLVAKIAGVSLCPDQAIQSISSELGTGRAELNSPACPASSQIGTISAGLGAGPGPNYFDGKVYLAGPYKGAQLSLAVVAPALAGPYDLGNVVVRTALYVDPETARVKAVSDPFPTILHGVILRVRDVRLRIDKPQTTINPTSCARMALLGAITGVGGSLQTTTDDSLFNTAFPFQVGSCGDLSFGPKLDLRLFGGTKRGAHPKFRAILTMPQGGANIASASVALPRSEFLDQGHIKTICTRVQFAQEACPAGSIYGKVEAKTPLLDETLTGNVYLRSSSHQLPDLVAAFRGGRIDANVVGRIDSVNGGIRNTFDFVPDVPVNSATFTFFGGKKGLLVNSRNICAGNFRATAKFVGHNGDALALRPKMAAKCRLERKTKKRKS